MSQDSLFRPAALQARRTGWLGDVVLLRPLSFTLLTALACAAAAVIAAFLACASYTKRSTVAGQLLPDAGLVKVYAPQTGIVLEKLVREGQRLRRGDVLYVLSSERQSSADGYIQASISAQVALRRRSLGDEQAQTRQLQQDERAALARKIASLEDELSKLDSQIEGQQQLVRLGRDTLARYQGLLAQHFISSEHAQQKQEALLDQENRLRAVERDRLGLRRELETQRNEQTMLAARHQNQLAQLERSIASTGQELTESEAKRRLVVTAPEAGIASGVVAEAGQTVDASRPLASIVPAGARLQARLYAPSRTIGFIKPGAAVLLRYQAYPYQKFGHARGVVATVSRAALPANELALIGNAAPGAAASGEPLYGITVALAAQTLTAYGQPQQLQAGMLLDADILQESRRLYEWVLEPLYSLSGKL